MEGLEEHKHMKLLLGRIRLNMDWLRDPHFEIIAM